MPQPGRNRGVTGLLDLQPIVDDSPYPVLQVEIQGFANALPVLVVPTTGPGDAFNEKVYGSNIGGGGTAIGTINSAQRPFPENIYNLQGTLKFQADADTSGNPACYLQVMALIERLECKRHASENDTWIINVTWRKNGPLTMVWNGSAVSYTRPVLIAKETNDQTAKADDPQSLTTSAVTHIFLPTFAGGNTTTSSYTDSDTALSITAYLSTATPPRPYLKAAETQFVRIDDAVGWLVVTWRLRDTKDDVELPSTIRFIDPANLQSSATVARVNNTTSTLTGFALRGIKNEFLWSSGTGSAYVNVSTFGLRSTTEDVTFPGTFTATDDNDLDTTGRQTIVSTSSAPSATVPSGLKTLAHEVIQLTSSLGTGNLYQTVYTFSKNDSKDSRTIPSTWTLRDPQTLNSQASVSLIDSTPSLPAGYKEVARRTQIITGDAGHTQTTIQGALRDSADEVLFPRARQFRSAFSPWISSIPEIVATSGDLPTQATSLWASFQSVVGANGLTLLPITDNKRVAIYEYINPGIGIEGSTGGGRYLQTKLNGTNPQVYVVSNISRGSSQRKIQLARQWVTDKPIRRFLLVRLLQGTTLPEQYPSQINGVDMPTIGDVNSSTFLGLAAYTANYEGPAYQSNLALSGTLSFFMSYHIRSDPAGIAQGLPDAWFNRPLLLPTSATNVGWTNVSTLGLADVSTPAASSFAAFLA